jgi:hypothetical protein
MDMYRNIAAADVAENVDPLQLVRSRIGTVRQMLVQLETALASTGKDQQSINRLE